MAHQKLKLAVVSAVIGLGMVGAGQARGAIVYSYVSDAQQYTAAQGSTVSVNIYLQEQTGVGDSSYIQQQGGIFAIGAQVSEDSTGSAAMNSMASNTADFGGPNSSSFTPTLATFIEAIASPPAPDIQLGNTGGGVAPAFFNQVYLGKVSVTVGSSPTVFTIGAVNDPIFGIGEVTLTKSQSDLDLGLDSGGNALSNVTGVNGSTTSFTVAPTPSPEPASLGLFAVGGLLALRRRRA